MTRHAIATLTLLGLAALGCARVPNPNYVDEAGAGTETGTETGDAATETGSTTGDALDLPGDGDGDWDPTGDGDGEPTGDGDGDPSCPVGEAGCACTPADGCELDLGCVAGICVATDSCAPVDDSVAVSGSISWVPTDPPVTPAGVQTAICAASIQQQGAKAVVTVDQCASPTVAQVTLQLQPVLEPLASLVGQANLAANLRVLVDGTGTFVRVDVDGLDLYYVAGPSLTADGLTEYPWPIAPFSSSCGLTPVDCGTRERLALLVDAGVAFDGTAAITSPAATVWAETAAEECGVLELELALIAH